MKNLILIGFMGAGKTTIGKLFSKEKGRNFVDTDERIVREQGKSIPELFDERGEGYFRDLETELLKKMLMDTKGAVISVGGGMPVRKENRELLRMLGCVIYLSATKETILSRVRGDGSRPMLNGEDLEARVIRLLQERETLYKKAAHVEVRTDGRSVYQVMQVVDQETRKWL